ncbi:hypothetical protein M514_05712 [Trichuris suis]|uniref:Uncharacterized protein n=1 Tax=Trichuris suis TaxID=68888 RepID=A0A085NAI4_9BILA|nr:hypothetical protein M513_05712 [Trichuris suis]KFD66480.1 hypothetical protein M514_05712 [Trichuris suis]KHJ49034.1 hypothetical protein D918_00152 [Trichuris suis]
MERLPAVHRSTQPIRKKRRAPTSAVPLGCPLMHFESAAGEHNSKDRLRWPLVSGTYQSTTICGKFPYKLDVTGIHSISLCNVAYASSALQEDFQGS